MKQNLLNLSISLASICAAGTVYAQSPSNDDPCGAIEISVNESGSICPPGGAVFSNAGAGHSEGSACGSTAWQDVWFKFTATSSDHRITRSYKVVPSAVNPGMAIYRAEDGDCESLISVACTTLYHSIDRQDFVPGETYYIRMWAASGAADYSFRLCVGTVPETLPANDECSGAAELSGGTLVEAYTDRATKSLPGYDCFGGSAAPDTVRDVWYKVTANADGPFSVYADYYNPHYFDHADTFVPAIIEYHTGCSGGFSAVYLENCQDSRYDLWSFTYTGQKLDIEAVAGQTYYFRVYGDNRWNDVTDNGAGYFRVWASEPEGGDVLPMEISGLTGAYDEQGYPVVRWAVLNHESFYEQFIIQRSEDAVTYQDIDSLPYHVNVHEYTYTDFGKSLKGANLFYRLKITGAGNSKTIYSNVVSFSTLHTGAAALFTIGPNPAEKGQPLFITIHDSHDLAGDLMLIDSWGHVIFTEKIKNRVSEIDLSAIQTRAGIYYIVYKVHDRMSTHKIIIN